jgi:hypothetical protein
VLDQPARAVDQRLHQVFMRRRLAAWRTGASGPGSPRWPISRSMFIASAESRHTSAWVLTVLNASDISKGVSRC